MMTPKEEQLLRKKLHRTDHRKLDGLMHEAHDKAFECIDCLDCGNCCKTTPPMLTDKDINRISKHLRMKVPEFMDQYVVRDKDDFLVMKETPCPFLHDDNYCGIYDVRPKACSEYPHTDRAKQFQLIELSLKNEKVCPAVERIMSDMLDAFDLRSKVHLKKNQK